MGTAKEEQYFYKKNKELTSKLQQKISDAVDYHERQILSHETEIKKLKEEEGDLEKEGKWRILRFQSQGITNKRKLKH